MKKNTFIKYYFKKTEIVESFVGVIMKNILIYFALFLSIVPSYGWGKETKETQIERFGRAYREIAIVATKEGFYPDKITVFEGEKVRFFITSTEENGSCFTLPQKNIFLSAHKGKITEADMVFDRSGEFPFYCSVGKVKGTLTVLMRESKKRGIASQLDKWVPKDY